MILFFLGHAHTLLPISIMEVGVVGLLEMDSYIRYGLETELGRMTDCRIYTYEG